MKNRFLLGWMLIMLTFAGIMVQCKAKDPVRIQFDSNMEVSGQKFAIKDISPGIIG